MKWLTKVGPRRGVQTIEFLVVVLGVVANVATAMADLQSTGHAVTWSTILAAIFIASRGLTKIGVGNPEDPLLARDRQSLS